MEKTQLNFFLHNASSIRNETKELSTTLEIKDLHIVVCVESWISTTSVDNCLVQQCFPRGFKFFNALRLNKRCGGICTLHRSDLLLENFEVVSSQYSEFCFLILRAEGITVLLIAVYQTPVGNIIYFIENFTHFFQEKRFPYDRMFRLGDLNIFLTTTKDAAALWSSFGRIQLNSARRKRIKKKGFLIMSYHPKNMCIEVTTNSFSTTSDHFVICFSLNKLLIAKPTQQFVYRNWKKFKPDVHIETLLNLLKKNHPTDVESAWKNYVAAEETILETLIPRKIETVTTHRCPFLTTIC